MKIFFAIDSLVKGGTERRMLELIKSLSEKDGYDIYLISLNEKVDYDYVYDLKIKFEVMPKKPKKDFSLYNKLYKKVKSFKPDIIHTWGSMSSVLLAPIASISGIKFVNGYIGQAPVKVSLKDKFYSRGLLTYPFSHAIVSNSQAGLISYKAPAKKSHVIYSGINFKRFENLLPPDQIKKDLFGTADPGFIVAMVAAFEDRKDHETFVKVAVKMCQADSSITFLAIGGGKTLDPIRAMVPPEYLDKRILLLGKRADVESILQIIDIGLLLTNSNLHGEGISNSIIEKMASRKPVIATRGGGTDEIINDGDNGLLVDFAATDQIIEKINLLRNNKELYQTIANNGYKTVYEKFNIAKMSDSYISLYNKLIAK